MTTHTKSASTTSKSHPAGEILTVSVSGMTCPACERRIVRALTSLPGVASASASSRRGTASVVATSQVSQVAVEKKILALGYRLGRSPWLNRDPQVWGSAAVAAVFVAVLVWVVGVGDLTTRLGDLSTGGLLLVLALGLAAGVSTCMAMVGGIVLAMSASAASGRSTTGRSTTGRSTTGRSTTGRSTAKGAVVRTSPWRINLAFQAGRIGGFGLLGAALGALGGRTVMPQSAVVAVMVVVAVAMLLVGLRLTELSPRLAGWSPTIPAVIGDRLGLTGDVPARRTAGAAFAGGATFFLPCGFTQAVQLYAFSTGSPLAAGAIMATFALGTAPALLALAGAPTMIKGRRRVPILRVLGVVVVGFAVINSMSALRLAGVDFTAPFSRMATPPPAVSANVTTTAADQTINSTQDGDGYHPGETVIFAGRPTHWVMTSSAPFSCASNFGSKELGFQKVLAMGRNVIELPKLTPGTYTYVCGMGMYSGTIVVIPATPTKG